MQRRSFIGLIGTAALSVARPAIAQTKADLPVVGVLLPTAQELVNERVAALRQGLQQEGFTEGINYSLAVRYADGHFDRLPSLAKELGPLKPRVIVAVSVAVSPARQVFPDLPIVFTAIAADPIEGGLATSYARPGGMLTGNVMNAVGGEETMTQKRIGFFKELVPSLTRLGMIAPDHGRDVAIKEKDALRKVAAQFA
jgi:putative ABC transport system substrate-binding protein